MYGLRDACAGDFDLADIPGNSSTTTTVTVGSTTSGGNATLETLGDHDWYRIELTAGQSITIELNGVTLEDPYLWIRDSSGNLLVENDDIVAGVNRDSKVGFTAAYTGTYYIDVGAWEDEGGYTGTYELVVSPYTPPPVWTYDEIADQLVSGYWYANGEAPSHFNVGQGGSITVNVTNLTSAGQFFALEALDMWSDVIGVSFVPVTSGGQITFDDNEEGAFSTSGSSGGYTNWAHVNVDTAWIAGDGTNLNSYSFQTYLHEIGHALGLGHAGNYNGNANYLSDALYANDAWSTTIMSYFDQHDNMYFAGQGFTVNFVVSPMLADVVAMSLMYGASTTTRTGDTIYGFGSNAGRAIYNAALHPTVAYTIFDSGGTDTLDYSGFSANQRIDLYPEAFSNVGGLTGNVSIARGVVIENAIGGSGADTITGNAASNTLEGGGGNDILEGEGGGDLLIGGSGDDQLYGRLGDDSLRGGSGDDRMSGDEGIDWVYYDDALAGIIVHLSGDQTATSAAGGDAAGIGTDQLFEIENVAGSAFSDQLNGSDTGNRLVGGRGDDLLYGDAGDDTLDGGAGIDRMYGGAGDDIYIVRDSTDYAYENAGEGTDRVISSVSHVLRANVEQLSLTGTANLYGRGNGEANVITGNSGANKLYGYEGSDRLYGGDGNDTLDGGTGSDGMRGDAGNDVYHVDDGRDVVVESAGGGTDTVYASVSLTLRANVERLTLTGSGDIKGTGNGEANIVIGNGGGNTLSGMAGNDRLYGNGGADALLGGDGNDVLDGGSGRDRFTGGAGADSFVFRPGDFAGVGSSSDQIHDFGEAEGDRIHLAYVDADSAIAGDQAFTLIGTSAFTGTAGELRYEQISGNTYVQGDWNGDGAADFWIRLDGLHTLGSDDFVF